MTRPYKMLCEPWVQITENVSSPSFVRELLFFYAGHCGAMMLFAQYIYNAAVLARQGRQDMADLFDGAANDEMMHIRQVARLIAACGGDPQMLFYENGRAKNWNTAAVNHNKNARNMLENAIKCEKEQQRMLQKLVKNAPTKQAQAVINRMMLNINQHIDMFNFSKGNGQNFT